MNITTYEYPFNHIVVDGFVPSSVSQDLFSCCNAIDYSSIDFSRDGMVQDSVEMFKNSKNLNPLSIEIQTYIKEQIDRVSRLFTDVYDSKNYGWFISANEVNRNCGNFLTPHTDDPAEMKARGMNPPVLRCLLYVADYKVDYPHYGTKIYADSNRSTYVKEVEFVPSRLLMFECTDKSWHGTDYIKGLTHRRFFINGLYQYITKTPGNLH